MTSIINSQIQALRREAIEHDDTAQRILCDMALDGRDSAFDPECLDADGLPDYSGGGHYDIRAIRRALRMSRDDARAECERVIADAAAQE